jgi:hypothetical protein
MTRDAEILGAAPPYPFQLASRLEIPRHANAQSCHCVLTLRIESACCKSSPCAPYPSLPATEMNGAREGRVAKYLRQHFRPCCRHHGRRRATRHAAVAAHIAHPRKYTHLEGLRQRPVLVRHGVHPQVPQQMALRLPPTLHTHATPRACEHSILQERWVLKRALGRVSGPDLDRNECSSADLGFTASETPQPARPPGKGEGACRG